MNLIGPDFDGTFFRGQKSDSDPGNLPLGYYWKSLNMLNVGGLLSCRPGHRCIVKFPQGNLQGGTIFRPKVGLEECVVCIDGILYAAPWPFVQWRQIPNIQMSPFARQVFWVLAVQSARRTTTDFASAIEVINPRNVLFIQDGGSTAPAFYDGSNSGHIRDNNFETPSGGPMVWVGDRLWVASKNIVFASDISNPFSFREQVYLGNVAGFQFNSDVTAMAVTPSLEVPQLAVFTMDNTSIIQANIRERSLWPQTPNFQTQVLPIGCTSQRSVTTHFGRLSWFSPAGIVIFDFATAGKLSVRIPVRDNEMQESKLLLSEDLSLVAGASYGQYTLLSVPAEDSFNRHTWVMNDASFETLSDDSGPSWSGTWTGTRPVEWIYGDIGGANRIFHVSTDEDGENRLWESFRPERLDNGCPIMWALFTRSYFGATGIVKRRAGDYLRMAFADVALCGVTEDLDLGVFFAGPMRGAFKQILGKKLSVAKGSLQNDQLITGTTQVFAFKPQSRTERTQDVRDMNESIETGSCGVEDEKVEALDEGFQLLIVGHGPATLRWIRCFGYLEPQEDKGNAKACEDEIGFNAVRFDGVGITATDSAQGTLELAEAIAQHFTSNQTFTITSGDFAAVGTGFAESVVSQRAADRVALRVATRVAETELTQALPPIFSVGKGFE